jgi:general secretion pathway protein I
MRAFTLVEVMVALALFFMAVFAILGLVNQALVGARILQKKKVDGAMVAAEYMALTNRVEEGLESGDFGESYPGFTWTRDVYAAGTNGLFQVDIIVLGPEGADESRLSIFRYDPQSQLGNRPRSAFGAGRVFQ